MISTIYQILRTIRPRQWLKNLALFAAPVFGGLLFDPTVFKTEVIAFIAFGVAVSGTYTFNDIMDAEKDKEHPVKKNRPIASGKLSKNLAKVLVPIFYIVGLFIAFRYVGEYFGTAVLAYILVQLSYSLFFRNVIILDALIVSVGFIIRVFAGGFAAEVSISSWLVLTTIGLSLLLSFGKRRSEKTILEEYKKEGTRDTLRHYPDSLLDSMISMSASLCILAYSLFAFQTSPIKKVDSISSFLPSILKTPKWMMLTIPIVIYGVARYLYIIYEKKEGESPARVLLSDKPILATVMLWGLSILYIVYFSA